MAHRLQPGEIAPNFTLPTLDGGEVSLQDYRDRPLVLVFTRYVG